MPLLDRTEVSPLPLPSQLNQLNPDTELWLIHQTGEIFTDYESYANRYIFYSQPIFNPTHHHQPTEQQQQQQQPVSFFHALNLEQQHLDQLIQSKFPISLKHQLIASINHPTAQLQPNIDHLVNYLYELYHNRFNVGEKVTVDLAFNQLQPSSPSSSSVYDAKVLRVFPPKSIRDLDKNSYSDLIHLQSIQRFQLDLNQCLEIDLPNQYLYTIQLIDHDQSNSDNFGASYMEVETRKLSRHTDTFSKALLKRFLQSVLIPYSSSQPAFPRWTIHPDVSIPNTIPIKPIPVPSYKSLVKDYDSITRIALEPKHDHHLLEPDPKKRKKNSFQPANHPPQHTTLPETYQDYLNHSTELKERLTCAQFIHLSSKQKSYQIDQLEPKDQYSIESCNQKKLIKKKRKKFPDPIDPSTIPHPLNSQPDHHHDHHLTVNTQLTNSADLTLTHIGTTTPSTATKESKKSIKYPIEDLDLDPFTVIDGRYLRRANPTPLKLPKKPQPSQQKLGRKFAQRLKIWSFVNIFKLNEQRCRFEELDESLDDLTASLVKLILSQSRLRYPTTRSQRFTSISVLPFFATRPAQECRAMSIDEREYWVRKGLRFVNITRRLHEFAMATAAGKRKNNRTVLEEDWVMGLVEIMCHRGGIERLGCMARMLKYFFSTDATLLTIDHTIDEHDDPLLDQANNTQDPHPKTKPEQANNTSQTCHPDLEGDSPLSSNIDDSLSAQESELSDLDKEEDVEPEAGGTETADEDGRRYGRSIRSQRSNPRVLKKTLVTRYASLPVDDKLTLIEFLCDLATESDQVRNYMDECDEKLTVVRREKADVNKEKRKVLEELARLETRKAEAALKAQPASTTTEPSSSTTAKEGVQSPATEKTEPKRESAGPTHGSPEVMLGTGGIVGGGEAEDEGSSKPRSSGPSKPTTTATFNSSGSRSMSLDGPSKPESPETQRQSKKPVGRRLETAVRTATLLARQIKPPSPTNPSDSASDPQAKFAAEKATLDNQLFDVGLKELFFLERFRQLIGVAKLKPLGTDRFFCKYWWFDGVGGLEIHSTKSSKPGSSLHPPRPSSSAHQTPEEEQQREEEEEEEAEVIETNWYAGCLFISGPTLDEWEKISSIYGGHQQLFKRRFHEELGIDLGPHPLVDTHAQNDHLGVEQLKQQIVGVDEWAIYETEEQIEELINWLNAKGVRENSLKSNLKEWKEYILDGILQRRRLNQQHQEMSTTPRLNGNNTGHGNDDEHKVIDHRSSDSSSSISDHDDSELDEDQIGSD
ncbi:hypothetical protein PGTUg99_017319 [Puccinia graminis f. sp. tritici]|uniref:WAC domain-containing protein n=1 Tax=Puccinia graminis f. sp. tritici TaxID=56615 RepID=A0A5B0RYP9_PUCGR|nr:hypothetical protein PGTUg99_017319 [Puccinia graminis f. sp. tritici]